MKDEWVLGSISKLILLQKRRAWIENPQKMEIL